MLFGTKVGLPVAFEEALGSSFEVLSLILPIITLTLGGMATLTYYTRNEVVEILKSDFIAIARSKGLSEKQIIRRHVFRNVSIPLVSIILPMFVTLLTGSLIIERFFAVPGTSSIIVLAVQNKETYIILFSILFYSSLTMLVQLLVDVLYVFIDPRIKIAQSPLNLSILVALLFSALVWFFLWHTRWGFAIRATGKSNDAAVYSGINPKKIIVVTMCISGALAGLVGINELMGVQHRLLLDFNYGYGFGGIAVALMGRNHPIGIIIAALLFGILYQGGMDLAFEMQNVSRHIIVVMQGLVILFCGGLEYLYRPLLIRFLAPIET